MTGALTDRTQVAEGFNNYFSKIGQKTSQNVPHSDKNFQYFMPESKIHSMFIEAVERSLKQLRNQKCMP